MNTDFDLTKMDLEALQSLQKDVAKAINDFEARRHREALAAARQTAKEHGFSLEDLVGKSTKPGKSQPLPVKYTDPDNAANTWSGRGRKPKWIKEALENGKTLEQMEV
jgi:DNA-binding protein H-NS